VVAAHQGGPVETFTSLYVLDEADCGPGATFPFLAFFDSACLLGCLPYQGGFLT
jgi:hypothetical protein